MLGLVGVALVSGLLYTLFLVRPFNLLELYQSPHLELYKLSQERPLARWSLAALFLVQAGLYWLGWRLAQRARGRGAWLVVFGGAVVLGASMLLLYPIDAADVFDNIGHGRILGVYGANPFHAVAADFADDVFLPYMAWKRSPSAYGPIWELLAAVVARAAGDGVVANVLAFKLLGGAFLTGSMGIVTAMLRRVAPERAVAGALFLGWNPVVLYETWGNGHNDIVMVFWVLVAAWAMLERRYTLAILSLLVGALIKYIPLLLLPAAGLIALRESKTARRRLRFVILTGILSVLMVTLAYSPFWYGIKTLSIDRRADLLTTSLPAAMVAIFRDHSRVETIKEVTSLLAAVVTVTFSLRQGLRAYRDRSQLIFVRVSLEILLFYLLLTCLWFQTWYTVWPLALAALLPVGFQVYLALVTAFATVMAKQFIIGPEILWIRPLPPKWWRELRLGPLVLALPWLTALTAAWRSRFGPRSGSDQKG